MLKNGCGQRERDIERDRETERQRETAAEETAVEETAAEAGIKLCATATNNN